MKLGIKPLVSFMNGPFISDEQNFLKSILPYLKRMRKAYEESVYLTMNVGGCGRCEEDVASEESREVGTSTSVTTSQLTQTHWPHEAEGHKCYPIGNLDKPSLPPSDKEENSYKMLKDKINSFQETECYRLRVAGNRLMFLKLFSTMANEKYVEYENVMGLTDLLVHVADYAATFAGSICMIEMVHMTNPNNKKPVAVVKISSYINIKRELPKTWGEWEICLRNTNISLAMNVMGPGEQIPLQSIDDTTVNWCFSVSHDAMSNVDAFILTDCKPIVAKNTYGLTIVNKDFTLNVASNLEMRVPNGTTFRFVASIDSAVIDSFFIKVMEPSGWKSYTATPRDVSTLKSLGIVIEDTKFSIEKTEYIISITRNRDIQISLNSMVLTFDPLFIPSWDKTTGALTVTDEAITSGTPVLKPALRAGQASTKSTFTAAFSLDFGFLQLEGTNVHAYVVPIPKYASKVDEDSVEVNISQCVPVRINTGQRILMTVNRIPVDVISDGTFLLRIVFGNGSLSTITETKDARSVKVGNYETAFQFEIKFDNETELFIRCSHSVSVVSTHGGYTFGTTGTVAWNPPIPMPLYANGIGIVSSEYYALATINPLNRKGTLTLKPNVNLEDVPLGIPAGAGACSLSIPTNPIDENYYFAFIKIPYTAAKSSMHISVPSFKMKGVHQITVRSGVRQLFDISSENCYYDELNWTAVYNHPTLTCDDKHVLLPVFFNNKDTIVITVEDTYCSGRIEFIIDVDLGDLPFEEPGEDTPPKEEDGSEQIPSEDNDNVEGTTPPESSTDGSGDSSDESDETV